jgi:hypothetical protein
MTFERARRLRWLAALGVAAGSVLIQGCQTAMSSCAAAEEANWKNQCFTKAELAADAGFAAGPDGGAAACPSSQQIQETRLNGYIVESVSDEGQNCCYRGYYPCE